MDPQTLEALFKMQGFAMAPALLDQLFADAPRIVIQAERDHDDYVDLLLCIEGIPGRRPACRVIFVAWRNKYIVLKMGDSYGICRNDGSPILWSRSAKYIADLGETGKV